MITWHNARTNPPSPLRDVLLAIRGEEQAAEGWRTTHCSVADAYMLSTGHPVPAKMVYAWAELPAAPVIIPEAQ